MSIFLHVNHLKKALTTEEEDYFVNNVFMRFLIISCDPATDFSKSYAVFRQTLLW